MADVRDCDVTGNEEVFDDVEVDSDPNNILNNVEQSCTKILIPSMAQNSMVKLSSSEHDEESSDVMFPALKDDVDEDDDSHNTKFIAPQTEDQLKRNASISVSSPLQRSVKWSLDTMADAMDSVLGGELTTTQAAKTFCIPRTTLLDRLAMKVKSQYLDTPGTFPLTPENDAKIVEFVLENPNLTKPTLIKGMMALADELANKQGRPFDSPLNIRKWLKLFVCKHPKLDILQYSRRRSSVHTSHISGSVVTSLIRSTSTISNTASNIRSGNETPSLIRIQHISQPPFIGQVNTQITTPTNDIEIKLPNDTNLQTNRPEEPVFDQFEINLAKMALEGIENKLSSEQQMYFSYRFFNDNLDRGYELWKHCKVKIDHADNENFEAVLSTQALNGIEQVLDVEHLKYFQFRYENPDLEEGFQLWLMMKKKSSIK